MRLVPALPPPVPGSGLDVQIDRGRSALRVSARAPGLSLDATFSGVPDGVSLGGRAVVIWCRAFSARFGSAVLER